MGLDNPLHIAFLLIIALLVFGAKRLPEMGRSLGSGMRGFKDALSGEDTGGHSPVTLATAEAQPLPVVAQPLPVVAQPLPVVEQRAAVVQEPEGERQVA